MSLKPAPLYHSGVETASALLSGGYRGSEIPDFVHSVVVLLFYLGSRPWQSGSQW